MIAVTILLFALADAKLPPPKDPIACTPRGVKNPPLQMVDKDGKCPVDTMPMKDKAGKPMYCVNTKHPTPSVCKPYQPPSLK